MPIANIFDVLENAQEDGQALDEGRQLSGPNLLEKIIVLVPKWSAKECSDSKSKMNDRDPLY